MRDYEVVYIFKSTLTTEEIEGRLEGYHTKILGSKGSEITAVEHWGKRQLAYPIDRNDNGYYVVTQFTASPSVLTDYERTLKLDDDLLRHLVVLSEGELPVPSFPEGDDDRRGPRDDDDDRRRPRPDAKDEGNGGGSAGDDPSGEDTSHDGDDAEDAEAATADTEAAEPATPDTEAAEAATPVAEAADPDGEDNDDEGKD